MRDFYDKRASPDYPPGYFFVLWGVGHAYKFLVHDDPGFGILKIFVKLPAMLMDLVVGKLDLRDRASLCVRARGPSSRWPSSCSTRR